MQHIRRRRPRSRARARLHYAVLSQVEQSVAKAKSVLEGALRGEVVSAFPACTEASSAKVGTGGEGGKTMNINNNNNGESVIK